MSNPAQACDVSVIVVTHNSASCIQECLRSVLSQQQATIEVIVVDNVSNDDTVNLVRTFGSKVKVIANRDNVGFGKGCVGSPGTELEFAL